MWTISYYSPHWNRSSYNIGLLCIRCSFLENIIAKNNEIFRISRRDLYHVSNCTTRLFYILTRLLGLKKLLLSFALISFSLYSSFTFGFAQSTEDMDQNQNQFVNSKDFNFVAAGDFGCNEDAKKTTQVMANENPKILIALGDLTESKSPDCWFDMMFSKKEHRIQSNPML